MDRNEKPHDTNRFLPTNTKLDLTDYESRWYCLPVQPVCNFCRCSLSKSPKAPMLTLVGQAEGSAQGAADPDQIVCMGRRIQLEKSMKHSIYR
eukprot:SAG31_NODE_849_length_11529_cov_3.342257_14_plen_93_part_00